MVEPPPSPIATLFPGYFALVMATGIVAIAADQQNLDLIAQILYVVTVVAYVVLAVLLATRMVRFWSNFAADVTKDEAIVLADRIAIFTARPGKVDTIIPVPFSRPRDPIALKGDPTYAALYAECWGRLRDGVLAAR